MLNRAFWGKGLMKDAVRRFLLDLGGNEDMRPIREIVADADPTSSAISGLFEKIWT